MGAPKGTAHRSYRTYREYDDPEDLGVPYFPTNPNVPDEFSCSSRCSGTSRTAEEEAALLSSSWVPHLKDAESTSSIYT